MNRAENSYWVQAKRGPWGPLDWKVLRNWLALGWLPSDIPVSHECEGDWKPASAVELFWVKTKGVATDLHTFQTLDLMSTKVPISFALRARIQSLGWPGDVQRLRNYYWGNKLRETLESLFPDAQRPLFDDPEWPWSHGSPAEAQRRSGRMQRERSSSPPTENQEQILQFFFGSHHGITSLGEASLKIEQLLNDAGNKARWEDHNNSVPATLRQSARLQWASTRLHRPLPKPLSKAKAHELIDAWFEEFPDLEFEWYEEKDRRADLQMEGEVAAGDVDDWREFHGCKPVSPLAVQSVLTSIGSRKQGEPIDKFMSRFFAELRHQEPTLFTGKAASANNRLTPRGTGCTFVLVAGLLIFILCVLCAMG
jgi:hypothetical protein